MYQKSIFSISECLCLLLCYEGGGAVGEVGGAMIMVSGGITTTITGVHDHKRILGTTTTGIITVGITDSQIIEKNFNNNDNNIWAFFLI